ncbi:MAG: ribosomal protein S18-alanine N-acetyltransferase [Mariprofundus sp.]|nr:ribosomal protein S18-alanine N-acetyltransferase [Mariprofundus sp.]
MNEHITLRAGNSEDVEAVYQLNREVFSECWSRTSIYSAIESGYDLQLCESQGCIIAYLLSLNVLDQVEIMQIAVSSDYRRQGLASRMTNSFVASHPEVTSMMLEVRLSNDAARACYARLGFEEVGYRKNYYAPDASGFCEDAVLMTRQIDDQRD